MTSPAVNINGAVTYRPTLHRVIHEDGRPDVVTSGQAFRSGNYRNRPASVTSPVRSDGTRAPKAWNHSGRFMMSPNFFYSVRHPYGLPVTRTYSGFLIGGVTGPTVSFDPKLRDRAVLKALQNLKDQKINLGVALAEARQTVDLVRGTADTVRRQVEGYKRNHKKQWERRGSWKSLPGRYLEMCYGWKPLLSDIDGACEQLAELLHGPLSTTVLTRASVKDRQQYELVAADGGFVRLVYRGVKSSKCQVTMVHHVPSYLSEFRSLGLENPLEILYEKTPYSFVLDWILPIGPWLGTLDAGNYMTFKEGSVSEMGRITATGSPTAATSPPLNDGIQVDTYIPGLIRSFNFRRSLLLRTPTASFPSLKKPLGLDKLAKSLALLTQVFRS